MSAFSNTPYAYEHQVAIEAVSKACKLAQKMQGTLEALDVVNKEDLSPVTITDFSCQALINMHLSKAFPLDPIMGEEDALFLRNPQNKIIKAKVLEQITQLFPAVSEEEILDAIDKGGCQGGPRGRFWVLDPIDGTRGFIHNEQYAVALALIEEGKVILSILGCPRLVLSHQKSEGGIFSALRGEGTFFMPLDASRQQPIHVNTSPTSHAVIYCEPHHSSQSHRHWIAHEVATHLHANPRPFRLDSQCKYALVAAGEASIYFRIPVSPSQQEKIWDHAAGMQIVEEAGGRVTDLKGKPLDFSRGKTLSENYGLLVTNGLVHEEALQAIQEVLSRH